MLFLVPEHAEYKNLPLSVGRIKIVKLPTFSSIFAKIIYRVYLELLLIPKLARSNKINSILAFGNFLMTPLKVKKVVLLHHPYLFDDQLFKKLSFKNKLVEGLKRCVFAITLKNVDVVVVQSHYVKHSFLNCWQCNANQVKVIPNPISDNFSNDLALSLDDLIQQRLKSCRLKILYVSRFYPHKNHQFLLGLSKALSKAGLKHLIQVTLDKKIVGVDAFMQSSIEQGTHIENIGEVPQNELEAYYKLANFFLFPSMSETFGNPIIEAMRYGLPVIIPDLPHAKAIVGEGGNYYEENHVASCVKVIRFLVESKESYKYSSQYSYAQFQRFPSVTEWVNSYIKLIS